MIDLPTNNVLNFSITNNLDNKSGDVLELADLNDLRESFKVNIQLNSTYEISFTLTYTSQFKDAYNLVQAKRGVWFNGQLYYIQQVQNTADENGLTQLTVTATAILIDLMKNVRLDPAQPTEDNPDSDSDSSSSDKSDDQQQDPPPGTVITKKTDEQQTFTLQNRLDQFFNNNDQGIKYELHGNFPQAAVECTGSLYEWLGSNLATFGAYYIPDNYVLKIYSIDTLQHKTDHEFRYLHNTAEINLQTDATSMVNDCEVFGGKMERDIYGASGDGSSGDGTGGNLDSVEGFCKSPINADFGVNKAKMIQDFSARSRRAQAWGVDANKLYDVVKQNGVSPEWFFAYELQEQLDTYGRDSWLNHYGYHLADPYQDAANVCNWIKSLAQNPNFTAATESGKGNQALAAQWNKEFPIGTIGRVYLQGTAAAAWELEGIAGGYYGKPLSGCVSVIKSWGGHTVKNTTGSGSWGWPFPNIPRDGEPQWINGQQYGHTGWIRPGSNTDFHDGFDFGASWYNGNVLAVHPGTVHKIGADLGWWYVWVLSNDGYSEIYQEGFTSRGDIYVNEGQQVNVGTPIGRVTGTHTHLGITNKQIPLAYYHGFNDDGTWLNPIQVIKNGMHGGNPSGSGSGTGTATIVKKGRADEFVNFCKSFVGKTPYVWGGNTPAGWDCSGFVAYVYNHFGVPMHQPTTYEEYQGTVVGPPYQTGDMLFWGARGSTYHTSLAMDATYRVGADNYQDGTVYRTIASYPPSFGVRNPQMVKILGDTTDDSGTVEGEGTTTQTYYSLHYHYRDEESVKKYGLHKGPPIVMDSLYDLDALQKYVNETVQHDPPTTLSVSNISEKDFNIGDVWHLVAPELNLDTDVTLMGISYNPYNPSEDASVTFNNTGLDMKNSIYAMAKDIKQMNHNVDSLDAYGTIGARKEDHFSTIDVTPSKPSKDSAIHFSEKQMEAIKAFTDS